MIEIPGSYGVIYHRFEPGEIIAPPVDFIGETDDYVVRHTWFVIGMKNNDVTVKVKPIVPRAGPWMSAGDISYKAHPYVDYVQSTAYRLATPEQIAKAIAYRFQHSTYKEDRFA